MLIKYSALCSCARNRPTALAVLPYEYECILHSRPRSAQLAHLPALRRGRSIVFGMDKPESWEEMDDAARQALRRAWLTDLLGAHNLWFEEDGCNVRGSSVVTVWGNDYYGSFELLEHPKLEEWLYLGDTVLRAICTMTLAEIDDLPGRNARPLQAALRQREEIWQTYIKPRLIQAIYNRAQPSTLDPDIAQALLGDLRGGGDVAVSLSDRLITNLRVRASRPQPAIPVPRNPPMWDRPAPQPWPLNSSRPVFMATDAGGRAVLVNSAGQVVGRLPTSGDMPGIALVRGPRAFGLQPRSPTSPPGYGTRQNPVSLHPRASVGQRGSIQALTMDPRGTGRPQNQGLYLPLPRGSQTRRPVHSPMAQVNIMNRPIIGRPSSLTNSSGQRPYDGPDASTAGQPQNSSPPSSHEMAAFFRGQHPDQRAQQEFNSAFGSSLFPSRSWRTPSTSRMDPDSSQGRRAAATQGQAASSLSDPSSTSVQQALAQDSVRNETTLRRNSDSTQPR